MSYHLSVTEVRECEVFCVQSLTGNLDEIFIRAIGQNGLRGLNGLPVSDVVGQLKRAYDHISNPANRDEYLPLNPINGWGSYENAMQVMRELLDACRSSPGGTIRID